MKIVYLITKLELGGAQKICLSLFNHFSPNAYLLSSDDGILVKEVKNNENFIPIKSLQRSLNFFSDIMAFFEIYFILKKLKNKHKNEKLILHTHSSKAGILGRFAGFLAGYDMIIHTVHGYGFEATNFYLMKKILIFIEQISIFFTTKIICVSKQDISTGIKLFSGFSHKVILIRAAVNEKAILRKKYLALKNRIKNIKNKRFIIGTISCFKPQKNLSDLLKMIYFLKQLLPKKWKLMLQVIGDGEERKKLENIIKQYKLGSNVLFLGWKQNVIKYMKFWNVFCLTSLWEGLPCSLIQARMLKIFSTCYDVGGIKEIINQKEKGCLIPVGKYSLMSIKILKRINKLKYFKNKVDIYSEKLNDFRLDIMLQEHEAVLVDK